MSPTIDPEEPKKQNEIRMRSKKANWRFELRTAPADLLVARRPQCPSQQSAVAGMKDDGPNKRHPTIAIPRVLWWFRQWPFWKTFFEGLGCRIITNDPARPTRRRHERASTIVEEACFPIQLLIDRTLAISDQADAIFMPRLISVVPRGIMCPRFTGVPDIVRMVLEQSGTGCQPVLLAPAIDARLTAETPPNPNFRASMAATIRRPRSFKCGHN
jgi:hypothetical protein